MTSAGSELCSSPSRCPTSWSVIRRTLAVSATVPSLSRVARTTVERESHPSTSPTQWVTPARRSGRWATHDRWTSASSGVSTNAKRTGTPTRSHRPNACRTTASNSGRQPGTASPRATHTRTGRSRRSSQRRRSACGAPETMSTRYVPSATAGATPRALSQTGCVRPGEPAGRAVGRAPRVVVVGAARRTGRNGARVAGPHPPGLATRPAAVPQLTGRAGCRPGTPARAERGQHRGQQHGGDDTVVRHGGRGTERERRASSDGPGGRPQGPCGRNCRDGGRWGRRRA
jgi:hypothetical protein